MRGPKVPEIPSSSVITPPGAESADVRSCGVGGRDDAGHRTERQADQADARRDRRRAPPPSRSSVTSDFANVIRSAAAWRLLSRLVNGLGRLMKCVPERSIRPSGTALPVLALLIRSTSNVRSPRADASRVRGPSNRAGSVFGSRIWSGNAVQRQVDRGEHVAGVGERVRHRQRLRAVARDAVLHDRERPARRRASRRRRRPLWRSARSPARDRDVRDLLRDRVEPRQVAAGRIQSGHRRGARRVQNFVSTEPCRSALRPASGNTAAAWRRRRCRPCPAALHWRLLVVRPVGTTAVGCAVAVGCEVSDVSPVDSVVKLQDSTTVSAAVPAGGRDRQVRLGQLANRFLGRVREGAAICRVGPWIAASRESSGSAGWPSVLWMPFVRITR